MTRRGRSRGAKAANKTPPRTKAALKAVPEEISEAPIASKNLLLKRYFILVIKY